MNLKKTNREWKFEQNNIIKLFAFISNKDDIDFFNIKKSEKFNLEVIYEDIFIKTAIRQKFVINIEDLAEIKQSKISKKIKILSSKEIKKLLVISSYNSLLADVLNQKNIRAIIYKGVVLSVLTKRKKTSRPCNDIDLLINKKDVDITIKTLENYGFKIKYGFFKNKSNTLIEKYYLFSQNALTMSKEIKELNLVLNIDLHWEIITTCPNMLSFSELWNNRKIIKLNGVKVNTLNYYYTYMSLCYNSAKNKWNNLNNLLDIALIYKRLSTDEKYKLSKISVIKKTNQVLYYLTNNKKFSSNIDLEEIINQKHKLMELITKSQLNLSQSINRKKEVNVWQKFSLISHRISLCESSSDKLRQVIINLIPVSLFIDKDNLIRGNPIFLLKQIFRKFYKDTIDIIKR